MTTEWERRVTMRGAFDKRHPDPNKNCGIHGMEIRFTLIGERGATHFVVFTPIHLPHVARELWGKVDRKYNPFETTGADIGYHSPVQTRDYQIERECDVLPGGKCWGDGSALQADEFTDTFLREGDAAVWPMLEDRYRLWFPAEEAQVEP